jgi:hypothetical protein
MLSNVAPASEELLSNPLGVVGLQPASVYDAFGALLLEHRDEAVIEGVPEVPWLEAWQWSRLLHSSEPSAWRRAVRGP